MLCTTTSHFVPAVFVCTTENSLALFMHVRAPRALHEKQPDAIYTHMAETS